jgi:drug/metabolite transporter (DMT)-like permease
MNPKVSLAIGIVCISFSPIFVRLAEVPPVTSGFYRIFIAWLALLPYCVIKGKLKIDRHSLIIAVAGGLVFGADIAVWNISLLKISATISTLLANLAPVWVGLLSFIILKKRSGRQFWIGTWIAISGMVLLVGINNILHLQLNVGILLAILASFFYAVYIMITKSILQKIDTLTFMFYNMLGASILLLVISLSLGNNLVNFQPTSWMYLIAMGLLCQLIGWITINHSLRYIESTKVSVSLLSQTVIAGLLAFVFLHEKLEFQEIAGSIVVLFGIGITFLRRRKMIAD